MYYRGPEANTVGYVVGGSVSHSGEENHGYIKDGKVALSTLAFGPEKHRGMEIPAIEVPMPEVTKVSDKVKKHN